VPSPRSGELAPPLDLAMMAELRELGDGDEAFVQDVLATYIEQANGIVAAMRAALSANDTRSFRLGAHALGGSSLQAGAAQVAGICHAIQSSEDDTPAPLAEALETVESELQRVCTAAAQMNVNC
jgi:HPt (histidine-containing phosphotransfer) domain-containing protein